MKRCFREEDNMIDRRGSISLRAALACFLIFAAHQAAQAGSLTTIHTFTGSPVDGAGPTGVVIVPSGVLYGTTRLGGNSSCYDCGTVFSLTPPATQGGDWTESVYSFSFQSLGAGPNGIIIGPVGALLYGTTTSGGTCGNGNVFVVKAPSPNKSWGESSLFSFCDPNLFPTNPPAIGPGGVLYGTLAEGSGSVSSGSVFSLTPPASPVFSWTENVLYTFTGEGDGQEPNGVAIDVSGALYGTTRVGGVSIRTVGTLYSLTPPSVPGGAWTKTILHNFPSSKGDGGYPASGVLIGTDGVLYGVTPVGGQPGCKQQGCGIVYSLVPPGSTGSGTYTIIHAFLGWKGGDGGTPSGGLVAHNGVLYGVTTYGGSAACGSRPADPGCGTIYSLTPPATSGGAWTETVLYSFTGGNACLAPLGQLAIDLNGVIYGVTATTVFSFTP